MIDGGSTDGSVEILNKLAKDDPKHMKVIVLRRNFGQTPAMAAGIDHSDGEIIVMMDADMQNDPKDIPMMIDKLNEGYDLVSGWRKNRKDTYLTRILPSKIANGLISRVTGVKIHDYDVATIPTSNLTTASRRTRWHAGGGPEEGVDQRLL